jgi:hypothetical protein
MRQGRSGVLVVSSQETPHFCSERAS